MNKILEDNQKFTISQVAKEANVNIATIRYYERNSLIAEPERNDSGYRQYTYEVIERIRFIKSSQELGFSLKEIKQILSLKTNNELHCGDTVNFTKTKIKEIEVKINKLTEMKGLLENLILTCQTFGIIRIFLTG